MKSDLTLTSPAKINLTLDILDKDETRGFHSLQTVFQRVNIFDEMDFTLIPGDELKGISNIPLPQDNTLRRAYDLFCSLSSQRFGLQVVLRKVIPSAAGLGGASSNAATVLTAMKHLFGLDVDDKTLMSRSASIGKDVPFFMSNLSTALGTGFGDVISSLPAFPSMKLLVIYPNVEVSTAKAYASLDLERVGRNLSQTDMLVDRLRRHRDSIHDYFSLFHNDFEQSVFLGYPPIRSLYDELVGFDDVRVMLSGSGSSLLVFGNEEKLQSLYDRYVQKYSVFLCSTY